MSYINTQMTLAQLVFVLLFFFFVLCTLYFGREQGAQYLLFYSILVSPLRFQWQLLTTRNVYGGQNNLHTEPLIYVFLMHYFIHHGPFQILFREQLL